LETNDSVLIAAIQKLYFTNDYIYVFDRRQS